MSKIILKRHKSPSIKNDAYVFIRALSFNCTSVVLMNGLIPHLSSLNTRKDKGYRLLDKGLPNNFRIRFQARRLVSYISTCIKPVYCYVLIT